MATQPNFHQATREAVDRRLLDRVAAGTGKHSGSFMSPTTGGWPGS